MKFEQVIGQLNRRAHRALISTLAFRSASLNHFLSRVTSVGPGEAGSLVADPIFEATFGYEPSGQSLRSLAGGLLEKELIEALSNPPKQYKDNYAFSGDTEPYSHQVTAWKTLLADDWKSVLVSSGTGSGKTECFLIPILNDLVREARSRHATHNGVRALFLYPLNALIKSQRDRLAAWTEPFSRDITFCLYNGETPHAVPQKLEDEEPQEVRSRRRLRSEPPSILVTNATMLEYMLVRKDDQPILEASQGRLRWIVLDEAHTYVGSQAAELAMLLRRVMIAFGVNRHDVRLVATSATIGENSPEGTEKLRKFLADMAGVGLDQVAVVRGRRQVPVISKECIANAQNDSGNGKSHFSQAATDTTAMAIRQQVAAAPASLTEICSIARESTANIDREEALRVLDRLAHAIGEDGTPFLPLRAHVFQSTFGGLWACADSRCNGRPPELCEDDWGFGKVFFHNQEFCDVCRALVFELVNCGSCGAAHLKANFQRGVDGYELRAGGIDQDGDDFQIEEEFEDDGSDDPSAGLGLVRLLSPLAGSGTDELCRGNHRLMEVSEGDFPITMQSPTKGGDAEALRCAHCGDREVGKKRLFRSKRLGAPFFLGDIIPTVLENCPPGKGKLAGGPSQGRQLITFTDSRQGTARTAARIQQDTDRNYVRSIAYHAVGPAVGQTVNSVDFSELARIEASYEQHRHDPTLGPILKSKLKELSEQAASAGQRLTDCPTITWDELKEVLSKDGSIGREMRESFQQVSSQSLGPEKFANYCLYREFARRPKRVAQSEVLGLVQLTYPKIENIRKAPDSWAALSGSLEEWRNFLTLLVDQYLRANSIIRIDPEFQNWMGARVPYKFVKGPTDGRTSTPRVRPWPKCQAGNRRQNRLIDLLLYQFGLSANKPSDRGSIDFVMQDAWIAIQSSMRQFPDGWQFDMEQSASFSGVEQAWFCPYTRRIVSRVLFGFSPYSHVTTNAPPEPATEISMPILPARYWQTDRSSNITAEVWLETDDRVKKLREMHIWPNRSDRAAAKEGWFAIGEHSAQQSSRRLDQLERQFRQGKVNVLSCSTTMEMGVDIGGMVSVVMNNVPPSQTNYLQRAGRAGRRQEPAALSVTLCKQTSHGLEVFNNPKWPFDVSAMVAPKVPFDSRPILQRHVNALLLSLWLKRFNDDIPKLNCGWFLEIMPGQSVARSSEFSFWCDSLAASTESPSTKSLQHLLEGTSLAGISVAELVSETTASLSNVAERWNEEVETLVAQRMSFESTEPNPEKSPPIRAIDRQLNRLRGEYLLKELTANGFLPGHGFPSGIVPMLTSTMKDFQRQTADDDVSRQDQLSIKRGSPTRQRAVAIREFAPGSEIVLDGAVYRSSGITLNWHVPAIVEAPPENLPLRWSWFCKACGAGGTGSVMPEKCVACQESNLMLNRIVEPYGFAVDIRYEPHNDVTSPTYLPLSKPRINIQSGDSRYFANRLLGKFRYSDFGTVLTYNAGPNGKGYSLCLYCGRAAPQIEQGKVPKSMQDPPHARLRGGKTTTSEQHCPGNDSEWAIKSDIWLAGEDITSALELRLRGPVSDSAVQSEELAWSIGYAFRAGLARVVGINLQEIGVAVQQVNDPEYGPVQAIYLYDTAASGAGYVGQLPENVNDVANYALSVLDCPQDCDSACNACLLEWDSQYQVEYLDRHSAFDFLRIWAEHSYLPEELHSYGSNVKAELIEVSESIKKSLVANLASEIMLFAANDVEDWELVDWELLSQVHNWTASTTKISLVVSEGAIENLPSTYVRRLKAFAEVSNGRFSLASTGAENILGESLQILAIVKGATTQIWASERPILVPGRHWGSCDGVLISFESTAQVPIEYVDLENVSGANDTVSNAAIPLTIRTELDGQLSGFGTRFWGVIESAIGKEISDDGEIIAIEYSDRYLRTPLHVKLLTLIVDGLKKGFANKPSVHIQTAPLDRGAFGQSPLLVNHNWVVESDRDTILRDGLERICSSPVTLQVKAKRNLAHSRELKVMFENGSALSVFLDEGVGCWRLGGRDQFDFGAQSASQYRQLCRLDGRVFNSNSEIGTKVFVARRA